MKPHTLIATIALALSFACGPVSPPPGPPGPLGGAPNGGAAGTAGAPSCASACANLARLGCPEDDCEGQCARIVADGRFQIDLACRANARTQAEAQACGPASCRP